MKITPEYLVNKNWIYYEDPILKNLSEEEKQEIGFIEYKMDIIDEEHLDKCWFITMRYQFSNTPNRDWSCHIDNGWHESIACVDIGSIEQFNKLMDLMDITYRLS